MGQNLIGVFRRKTENSYEKTYNYMDDDSDHNDWDRHLSERSIDGFK